MTLVVSLTKSTARTIGRDVAEKYWHPALTSAWNFDPLCIHERIRLAGRLPSNHSASDGRVVFLEVQGPQTGCFRSPMKHNDQRPYNSALCWLSIGGLNYIEYAEPGMFPLPRCQLRRFEICYPEETYQPV